MRAQYITLYHNVLQVKNILWSLHISLIYIWCW